MFQLSSLGAPVTRRASGLIAIILAASAAPALAETPIGEISGEIGGEAFVWETLDVPSEGTATAEFSEFGPVTTVSIQGHERGGESRMRNVISLDVTLMGDGPSAEALDPTLSLFPEGMTGPFYTSGDGEVDVLIQFDELDLSERGHARGSFSGQLCRQDGMFAELDLDDCRPIEGTFDTTLHLAEY